MFFSPLSSNEQLTENCFCVLLKIHKKNGTDYLLSLCTYFKHFFFIFLPSGQLLQDLFLLRIFIRLAECPDMHPQPQIWAIACGFTGLVAARICTNKSELQTQTSTDNDSHERVAKHNLWWWQSMNQTPLMSDIIFTWIISCWYAQIRPRAGWLSGPLLCCPGSPHLSCTLLHGFVCLSQIVRGRVGVV